jgi:hypothetical protein
MSFMIDDQSFCISFFLLNHKLPLAGYAGQMAADEWVQHFVGSWG